jgi:hypothetical protein
MYSITFSDGLRQSVSRLDYATRVARTFTREADSHSATIRDGGGRVRLDIREDGSEFAPPSRRQARPGLKPLGERVRSPLLDASGKLDLSAINALLGTSKPKRVRVTKLAEFAPTAAEVESFSRDRYPLVAEAPTHPGVPSRDQVSASPEITYANMSARQLDDDSFVAKHDWRDDDSMNHAFAVAVAARGSVNGERLG